MQVTPNIVQIIHLPNGRWCLELNGIRSQSADYAERIVTTLGRSMFAAQTCYYGNEQVWKIASVVTHQTQDKSLT